jgi:hypothetical protein
MNNKTKICIALMIFIGIIFFFIGRATIDDNIIYLPGETITDSIPYPVPYDVEVPSKPKYIIKRDTIRDTIPGNPYIVIEKVDTMAILADWILKRRYKETLFDNDTIGKFELSFYVQYNQAEDIKYVYTPMIKQVVSEKVFLPYIGVGYSVVSYGGISLRPVDIKAGIFIKDVGVEVGYMLDFSGYNGYRVGVVKKF